MSDNPFETPLLGAEYQDVRPGYPKSAVLAALAGTKRCVQAVADIGAGTGKFSRALLRIRPELRIYPIEPAEEMRRAFLGEVAPIDGSAEETGLPAASVDLAIWAQSFHWADGAIAGREARRILRPDGAAVVIYNQLDVAVPWVHRLTRIMRSGDVHREDRPPRLEGFQADPIAVFPWNQSLAGVQVLALARTRSSYLHSTDSGRRRMQANLTWYLHQHLGYGPEDRIVLPYATQVWVMR